MFRRTLLASVALASITWPVGAQQVLEIDLTVGRTVIDDPWRSMGSLDLAVDRDRAVLYVNDNEEPNGVMAFSLNTGMWIRTIQTQTGDGPYELRQGKTGLATALAGGLYVAGVQRVIEFDSLGIAVEHWQPDAPMRKKVCNFGGEPGIPAQNGVIRRTPDGMDEGIGPNVVVSHVVNGRTHRDAMDASDLVWTARIACSDSAAYVVLTYDAGPDSLFVYHMDGRVGRVAVPTDLSEESQACRERVTTSDGRILQDDACPIWSRSVYPSVDSRGNILLSGTNDPTVPGAIIDPDTGCYAMVRSSRPDPTVRFARVYQDSALVFHRDNEVVRQAGRPQVRRIYSGSNRVSLHPLRPISGEPCPGMLPSVNQE